MQVYAPCDWPLHKGAVHELREQFPGLARAEIGAVFPKRLHRCLRSARIEPKHGQFGEA